MKLKARSNHLLSVLKSKAKMYEFGVDEADHNKLTNSPELLVSPMIGILGEICAQENRGSYENETDNKYEYYRQLKSELVSVAQYFDALDNSRLTEEMSDYLKIVGAVAYYLANMPGSSSVLSKQLGYQISNLTTNYIEGAIIWMLKGDLNAQRYHIENSEFSSYISNYINAYTNYFNSTTSKVDVLEAGRLLRNKFFYLCSDREFLFIDILLALGKRKMENSSLNCLPLYTSLTIADWENALRKDSFIKEFWPAQKLLGEKGVFTGKSAVIQLPTSAGKTKSMEILIRSAFLSQRTGVAVLIAPFRALCREIADSFSRSFDGENVRLNELTDIPQVSEEESEFLTFLLGTDFQNPNETKSIVVSTPEKFVYLLRRNPEVTQKIGLLIFDEGHQFDSGERGVSFELLVASLIGQVNRDTQIILISAVISNAKTIGEWLYGENGIEVEGKDCLPTLRSIAFANWTSAIGQLHYRRHENYKAEGYYVPKIIESKNLGRRFDEKADYYFPSNKPSEHLTVAAYLGLKLSIQAPTAIFCATKTTVESVCGHIIDVFDRGMSDPSPLDTSDEEEIKKLFQLAALHFGSEHFIPRSICLGALPHSSSVPQGLRSAIEHAMEQGLGSLVICTSTLAQGVNLPIKYLLISSTQQSKKRISNRDFHNLVGRVGRAGHHTEGSIIFTNPAILDRRSSKIVSERRRWSVIMKLLDHSKNEKCLSSLQKIILERVTKSNSINVLKFVEDPDHYISEYIINTEDDDDEIDKFLSVLIERRSIVEKIESFMLSHLKYSNEYGGRDFLNRLVMDTLAYHLATNDEKDLLIQVFERIADKVLSVPEKQWECYGRSLLGISQLVAIESWLSKNLFELQVCNNTHDLLRASFPLIILLSRHELFRKIESHEVLYLIIESWVSGHSYNTILESASNLGGMIKTKRGSTALKMKHVIELVDNALGYESVLIVGALADIIEATCNDQETAEKIRELQASLKCGLYTPVERWFFNNGINDREICKRISTYLHLNGVNLHKLRIRALRRFTDDIKSILSAFPSVFADINVFD